LDRNKVAAKRRWWNWERAMTTSTVVRDMLRGASLIMMVACSAGHAIAQEAEAAPPPAQEETVGDAVTAGEIIVTAQRRAERLQDVPIAISAVGSDQLAQTGANDLSGLRGSVPGLTISSSAGINVSNLISIRGIGGLAIPIGTSQATAFYLDGVYLSRPDAAFFGLDDVERIEVLRGPQGALYGRNATAGAINVITREPGTDVRASFDVRAGNFDSVTTRGSVSGPLGGGFSAGVSASYDVRDGYYFNVASNARVAGWRGYTVRGKLRYATEDNDFKAIFTADRSHRRGKDYLGQQYITSNLVTGTFVGIGNPDQVNVDTLTDSLTTTRISSEGLSLTLDKQAGAFSLTSVTGFRKLKSFTIYDVEGLPLSLLVSGNDSRGETFSQELRAVASLGSVRITGGANYYREKASVRYTSQSPLVPLRFAQPYTETEINAYALFGQVELDIMDQLTLVGGLRLNHEKRTFLVDYTQGLLPLGKGQGELKDTALIPSVGVNFEVNPDILIYGKYSQGYQAPGYNAFVSPSGAGGINTFDAEKLSAWELGVKSQFLDGNVTLNLAAFYYNYNNLQVRTAYSSTSIVINNAATAKIKGIEGALTIRPVQFLTLTAQGTYLDASYQGFCEPITNGSPRSRNALCAPGIADRSGNRLNQAPEWSGGLGATLDIPLSDDVALQANALYSWESNVFYSAANEPIIGSGGWDRIDGQIGIEIQGRLQIFAWGKNLTDKRYISYTTRAAPAFAQRGLNDPRTYGFGLRFTY